MNRKKHKIFTIKKGLNLKLNGEAALNIENYQTEKYALQPGDFRWIVPKLTVKEGDLVKVGTPVFTDKEDEKKRFVSPVSGTVEKIMRGEKRRIEKIVISSDNRQESEAVRIPENVDRQTLIEILLQYGLWPFVIQRPFGNIADYRQPPKAIFISCFDSAPLAPDYSFILQDCAAEFYKGIQLVTLLTDGITYLGLPYGKYNTLFERAAKGERLEPVYFKGPHPAGNVGTQINRVEPIRKGDTVWCIDPQDVVTIGQLFLHSRLDFGKAIALTGPAVRNPHYLRLLRGASMQKAMEAEITSGVRAISGNVLSGRQVAEDGFLGYYDRQFTLLPEGGRRHLFGWLLPGLSRWSYSHTYLSWLFPDKHYAFDTSLNGGHRTLMLPETYDRVCPLDIMPAELLKACMSHDFDKMEALGIYDVVEEDFALCDVVSPSKTECQQIIFDGLTWLRTQL